MNSHIISVINFLLDLLDLLRFFTANFNTFDELLEATGLPDLRAMQFRVTRASKRRLTFLLFYNTLVYFYIIDRAEEESKTIRNVRYLRSVYIGNKQQSIK